MSEIGSHQASVRGSLAAVITLLEREIERLEVSLETCRLSRHPSRARIIGWHVGRLDERHDALAGLLTLVAENKPANVQ